ncbi:TPA: hypothetical protein LTW21_002042 [Clostridioides difficile]|nr:hypothetical protein [Clostridioides difficile]HAT4844909.1 hypothetical protein [Clostridioides difficile]HBG0675562.1 hypothetical protein [Clostridioides difficile]HBL8750864.1 hypothetical protein [Clostridioides difficile]
MNVENIEFSFILTKWYVNLSFTTTISLAFICFILTKWYVNGKIWEKLTNIMQSFILTKWYVNEIFSAIATTLVCVLY